MLCRGRRLRDFVIDLYLRVWLDLTWLGGAVMVRGISRRGLRGGGTVEEGCADEVVGNSLWRICSVD